MRPLRFGRPGEPLSLLCIGAHSDDIEIGAGATLLTMIAEGLKLDVRWCVLSARGKREDEASASAAEFLAGAETVAVELAGFDDSYFPTQMREIKEWLTGVRGRCKADIVFTHRRDDAHQDHRTVNELTWNLFRDHTILEYEIPKWDGDLGQPNFYMPVPREALSRKVELLMRHFGSQRSKDWFDPETFTGLARLRGMECRAPEGFAEAFTLRKASLSFN